LFNDTIVFYFNPKSVKQVPVIPRLDIQCMPQYQVSDSIRIEPKYVGIAGMEKEVEQVKYIETHPLAFRNLNQTTTKKIRLAFPGKKDQLELTTTEVTITIPVEKYTEAELEIPVEVENLPQDYTIKTFPEKVNVRFMIPFGDYKNMHPGLFKAVINFEQAASGNNKLKVNIARSPSSARSVKIIPEKVEFIIRK
jgi:YbbR domain-containing protein